MSSKTRKAWHLALQSLIAAGTLTLAGCDGGQIASSTDSANDGLAGDGLAGDGQSPVDELRSADGTLISQRSAGAKICYDINANRRCDTLEPSTITSADGQFSLTIEKAPADIIAELPADENGTIVRLFAHANSPTVSALTTVMHWSALADPTRPVDEIAAELEQILALDDLDSRPPMPAPEESPSDPAADDGAVAEEATEEPLELEEGDDTEEEVDANEPTDVAVFLPEESPVLDQVANARVSIELLIAKMTAAAEADALAAGLDPGMDSNQSLLNMVMADQILKQLPELAKGLLDSDGTDAQAIVDSLPDPEWPADDIALAMQMFAGDAPMEADPIALLEDGLNSLMKVCEEAADCPMQQTTLLLDDEMNLSYSTRLLFSDGSEETAPSLGYEITNLVLLESGEWKNLDTSRMASVTQTGEYSAEMTDGNNTGYSIRATSRDLAGTPVEPLLDTLDLATEDFPSAQESFSEKAKLVSLQIEQLNDRYELVFSPSDETLESAAAMQALEQATITLARLESSFEQADDSLSDALYTSERSAEEAAAADESIVALETAITAITAALEEAQTALTEATSNADAVAENADLIAAYESVLSDAEENLSDLQDADSETGTALSDAQANQEAAAQAVFDAEEALAAAIAATETVEEEQAEEETTTEEEVAEDEEATDDSADATTPEPTDEADVVDPAVAEAEAVKLQAERDLILADAELATAEAAATDSLAAIAEAEAELVAAQDALAEAQANEVGGGDTDTALQSAELLVSANEANLVLIEQQLIDAEANAAALNEQADLDADTASEAQSTLDSLASQLASATDELAAAQAANSLAPAALENGCDGLLPAQSADNLNCASIERRIGDSPTTMVQTLAELTNTSSTLTLLNLHSDYAVSMIPADSAISGSAAWHAADDSFDANDDALPISQWTKQTVNGLELITFAVPAALQEVGSPTELFVTVQDNYVRPGIVISAGEVNSESLLNDTAVSALLP